MLKNVFFSLYVSSTLGAHCPIPVKDEIKLVMPLLIALPFAKRLEDVCEFIKAWCEATYVSVELWLHC